MTKIKVIKAAIKDYKKAIQAASKKRSPLARLSSIDRSIRGGFCELILRKYPSYTKKVSVLGNWINLWWINYSPNLAPWWDHPIYSAHTKKQVISRLETRLFILTMELEYEKSLKHKSK